MPRNYTVHKVKRGMYRIWVFDLGSETTTTTYKIKGKAEMRQKLKDLAWLETFERTNQLKRMIDPSPTTKICWKDVDELDPQPIVIKRLTTNTEDI